MDFRKALLNSTILVPILSTTALQRMLTHNPEKEDTVLIDWVLALACVQDPIHSKRRGIYPRLPTDAEEVTVKKENIDTSLSDNNLMCATALQTVSSHKPKEEGNLWEMLAENCFEELEEELIQDNGILDADMICDVRIIL